MILKISFFTLLLFAMIACTNCNTNNSSSGLKESVKPSLKELAGNKYGKNYRMITNSTKTHTLCIKDGSSLNDPAVNRVDFFVFDNKNKEIILDDKAVNCNVNWQDENTIAVVRIPGIVKKNEDVSGKNVVYLFNIIDRKKIK